MERLFKSNWFWFLIIFPIYNPTALQYIPELSFVYQCFQVWKLISLIIIVLLYLSQRKISVYILAVSAMEVLSVAASALNNVYSSKVYTNALLAVGLCMMTELAIRFNFDKFINNLFRVLLLMVSVNFVLCLIEPHGLSAATLYNSVLNPLYFIAIDNGMIKEIIPLLVAVMYIYYSSNSDKEKTVAASKTDIKQTALIAAVFAVSAVTLLIVDSATGIIVFVLFTVLLFAYNNAVKRLIPYKLMGTLYVLFMLFVVMLGSELALFDDINHFMGRTGTFTGRMLLWREAMQMIRQRPFLGYGYTSGNIEIWNKSMSSHNLFLELVLQNGLLFFFIFAAINISAMKRNRKERFELSNLVFMGIFSYLLVGLMEVGISPSYYILLTMAWLPVYSHNKIKSTYVKY